MHLQENEKITIQIVSVLISTQSAVVLTDRFHLMLSQHFVERTKQLVDLTGGWQADA